MSDPNQEKSGSSRGSDGSKKQRKGNNLADIWNSDNDAESWFEQNFSDDEDQEQKVPQTESVPSKPESEQTPEKTEQQLHEERLRALDATVGRKLRNRFTVERVILNPDKFDKLKANLDRYNAMAKRQQQERIKKAAEIRAAWEEAVGEEAVAEAEAKAKAQAEAQAQARAEAQQVASATSTSVSSTSEGKKEKKEQDKNSMKGRLKKGFTNFAKRLSVSKTGLDRGIKKAQRKFSEPKDEYIVDDENAFPMGISRFVEEDSIYEPAPDWLNDTDHRPDLELVKNNDNDGKLFVDGQPFWKAKSLLLEKPPPSRAVTMFMLFKIAESRQEVPPKHPDPKRYEPLAKLEKLKALDNEHFGVSHIGMNTIRSIINLLDYDEVQKPPQKISQLEVLEPKRVTLYTPDMKVCDASVFLQSAAFTKSDKGVLTSKDKKKQKQNWSVATDSDSSSSSVSNYEKK